MGRSANEFPDARGLLRSDTSALRQCGRISSEDTFDGAEWQSSRWARPGPLQAVPVAGKVASRRGVSASGRIGAEPAAACTPDRPETEKCGANVPGRANEEKGVATSQQATQGPLQARADAHPESTRPAALLSEGAIGRGCEQVAPPAGTDVRQSATPQNRRPSFARPIPHRQSDNRQLTDGPSERRTRRSHAQRPAAPTAFRSGRRGADGPGQTWRLVPNSLATHRQNGRCSLDCGIGGEAQVRSHREYDKQVITLPRRLTRLRTTDKAPATTHKESVSGTVGVTPVRFMVRLR